MTPRPNPKVKGSDTKTAPAPAQKKREWGPTIILALIIVGLISANLINSAPAPAQTPIPTTTKIPAQVIQAYIVPPPENTGDLTYSPVVQGMTIEEMCGDKERAILAVVVSGTSTKQATVCDQMVGNRYNFNWSMSSADLANWHPIDSALIVKLWLGAPITRLAGKVDGLGSIFLVKEDGEVLEIFKNNSNTVVAFDHKTEWKGWIWMIFKFTNVNHSAGVELRTMNLNSP